MSTNKITITFYTLLVIIGLSITIESVFADDNSSLEIHNDVIYGGDQEQKQYGCYGNQADLFLGKREEQNKAFKKEEKRQFNELTDKMFREEWNQKKSDAPSKDQLFQANYSFPEFITNDSEDTSDSLIKALYASLLLLGSTLIVFIGWKLGNVFSNFQLQNKEQS